MVIEKVYPAGWKVTDAEGKETYFGEYGKFGCYCNEGVVYKNREAFESGVGVCYINEYGFENDDENSAELFEFYAKECNATELEGNHYFATEGYTRKDLEELCEETSFDAEDLFDHLDWMAPETLINEWIEEEDDQEEESETENPKEIRFFFPITVDVFERGSGWGLEEDGEYDGKMAARFKYDIKEALAKYQTGGENMAEYFDEYRSKTAKEKLVSCEWSFAEYNDTLFGMVIAIVKDPLSEEETKEFKDWIEGQNSDGLGEGFEQMEIKSGEKVLSVHFWQSGKEYKVMTEEEFRKEVVEKQ